MNAGQGTAADMGALFAAQTALTDLLGSFGTWTAEELADVVTAAQALDRHYTAAISARHARLERAAT